eukprot:754781-Hanusia_phi.AAC.1
MIQDPGVQRLYGFLAEFLTGFGSDSDSGTEPDSRPTRNFGTRKRPGRPGLGNRPGRAAGN